MSLHNRDSAKLGLSFMAEQADNLVPTKANIENDIYDVNIFLYNTEFGSTKHYYLSVYNNNILYDRIVQGNYAVYVIANHGSSLRALDVQKLITLKSTISNEADITSRNRMIMTTQTSLKIVKDTTLSLLVKRLAAKVNFNISISSVLKGAKIVHIQPYNCNNMVYYFQDSRTGNSGSYPAYNVASLNLTKLSHTYYLLENKAGNNHNIMTYKQRIAVNAPPYAPYVWIRVEYENKYIDYKVYIGENLTDDFNICRNKNYTYNIRIIGANTTDLRVSTTDIQFYSGRPVSGVGDYTHNNKFVWSSRTAYVQLDILTENTEADNTFYVSFHKLSGTFAPNWTMSYQKQYSGSFPYTNIKENQSVPVFTGNGHGIITFAFTNDGSLDNHTTDNRFYFTVRDKHGYCKYFTLTTSNTL